MMCCSGCFRAIRIRVLSQYVDLRDCHMVCEQRATMVDNCLQIRDALLKEKPNVCKQRRVE